MQGDEASAFPAASSTKTMSASPARSTAADPFPWFQSSGPTTTANTPGDAQAPTSLKEWQPVRTAYRETLNAPPPTKTAILAAHMIRMVVVKSFALLIAIAVLTSSASTVAGTPELQLMVPIRQLSDSFNKGDMQAAAATLSPDAVTIIDEISPHIWQGPHAFNLYLKSYAVFEKAQGISDEVYKPGKPTRVVVSGNDGYVALPVTYTFKQKGKPMRTAAQMVYILQKGVGGWLITSFTWVGSDPKPTATELQP